jgi:hypothetical protein
MDELDEATARAINAQPWEPLPGMLKRRCLRCRYVFAVRLEVAVQQLEDLTTRNRGAYGLLRAPRRLAVRSVPPAGWGGIAIMQLPASGRQINSSRLTTDAPWRHHGC